MNDLSQIMPKILARSLMVLRGKLVMPRLVNGDYAPDAAKKGDVINVPIPTGQSVTDVTPSNAKPALVDKTPDGVSVPLDQWKMTSFHLSDKDMVQIDSNEHFLPMQTQSAIDAIAENVNGYLLDLYAEVPNFVGTANTTPFATTGAAAIDARKKLHAQKAPRDQRRMVLDLDAEANALALAIFGDVEKVGERNVKIEGEIGRKYGFDFFSDQQVSEHTTGAATGTTIAIDNAPGPYAVGTETLHVDGLTAGFVRGDLFTIAGNTTQYTVISATTLAGADQDITISPPLAAAAADGAVITVIASHTANLAFHRDAFAFAMRPLAQTSQSLALGSQILSLTDPVTGITLRLEVTRVHKAVVWEFDVLYGGRLVRPELAVRVLG